MNLSWRWRAFLAYALGVGLAVAVVTLLIGRVEREWLLARDVRDLARSARHAAADVAEATRRGGLDAPALAASLGKSFERRVTLIDAQGRVLGDSDVPRERLATVENHAGRPEVRAALGGGVGSQVRTSATVGRPFLYVAVPAAGPGPVAVVRVAEPLAAFAEMSASLRRIFIVFAVATLVILCLLYTSPSPRDRQKSRMPSSA